MIYILRDGGAGDSRHHIILIIKIVRTSTGPVVKICLRFRKNVGPAGPDTISPAETIIDVLQQVCGLLARYRNSKNFCLHDLSHVRDAHTRRMLIAREMRDFSIETRSTIYSNNFYVTHTHSSNFVFYNNNTIFYCEIIIVNLLGFTSRLCILFCISICAK